MRLAYYIIFSFFFISLIYGQEITIYSTNVNSTHDDYAPTFYKSGIMITSNKKNSLFKNYFEKGSKKESNYLNNLYYYTLDKDSSHFKSGGNSFELNTPHLHEGPSTFSKQFDTIYFAKNVINPDRNEKMTIGIFYSVLEGENWSTPLPLAFNNNKYNFSHPSLSKNGNRLYFVSDLPDGLGGKDIWFCDKINNLWCTPINAGRTINTDSDEIFPYISHEGVLYFSSNRVKDMGFDIYRKVLSKPYPAKQLPQPINSTDDDYSYITMDNEKSGYFSSNRDNSGDDIFFFKREIEFKECEKAITPQFCYTFYDSEQDKKEPHVKYVWDFGDGVISHEMEPYHCFKTYGEHPIKLSMTDTLTGVITESVSNYKLNIRKNISYFLSQDHIKLDDLTTIKVVDIKSDTVENESISWLLEDHYFFDQTYLDILKNTAGEYSLLLKINDQNKSCIKSDLIIDKEELSSDEMFKVLPRGNNENPTSAFVQNKLEEFILNHGNDTKSILKIPVLLKKNHSEWAINFKNNIFNKYKIDVEIQYPSYTEMNHIYLSISTK